MVDEMEKARESPRIQLIWAWATKLTGSAPLAEQM